MLTFVCATRWAKDIWQHVRLIFNCHSCYHTDISKMCVYVCFSCYHFASLSAKTQTELWFLWTIAFDVVWTTKTQQFFFFLVRETWNEWQTLVTRSFYAVIIISLQPIICRTFQLHIWFSIIKNTVLIYRQIRYEKKKRLVVVTTSFQCNRIQYSEGERKKLNNRLLSLWRHTKNETE